MQKNIKGEEKDALPEGQIIPSLIKKALIGDAKDANLIWPTL